MAAKKKVSGSDFVLWIDFGNAGMKTRQHLAAALHKAAEKVLEKADEKSDPVKIMDGNGNTVGAWTLAHNLED